MLAEIIAVKDVADGVVLAAAVVVPTPLWFACGARGISLARLRRPSHPCVQPRGEVSLFALLQPASVRPSFLVLPMRFFRRRKPHRRRRYGMPFGPCISVSASEITCRRNSLVDQDDPCAAMIEAGSDGGWHRAGC